MENGVLLRTAISAHTTVESVSGLSRRPPTELELGHELNFLSPSTIESCERIQLGWLSEAETTEDQLR